MTTTTLTVRARVYTGHKPWLKARKSQRRYGGTTVPTVLGMSDYRTGYEQWAEWNGTLEPQEQSNAMEAGLFMEASILAWYASRYGLVLDGLPGPCAVDHPTDELASCSPDAMVVTEDGLAFVACDFTDDDDDDPVLFMGDLEEGQVLRVPGVIGGVDAKNLSTWAWRDKLNPDGSPQWGPTDDDSPTDDVPRVYWVQAQWSCYCTGAPWWDLAVLWDGHDLVRYRIHADTAVQEALAGAIHTWHQNHVVANVAPDIDVRQGKRAKLALLSLFSKTTSAQVYATPGDVGALIRYHQCKALERRAKAVAETIQVRMINRLGPAGQLVLEGHDAVLNGDTGKPNKAKAGRMMLATLKAPKDYQPGPSWEGIAREACDDLAQAISSLHPGKAASERPSAETILEQLTKKHTPTARPCKRKLNLRHGRTPKSMAGMLAEAVQVLKLGNSEDPLDVATKVLLDGVTDPRGTEVFDVEHMLESYEPAKPPERDASEPLPDEDDGAKTAADTGAPPA